MIDCDHRWGDADKGVLGIFIVNDAPALLDRLSRWLVRGPLGGVEVIEVVVSSLVYMPGTSQQALTVLVCLKVDLHETDVVAGDEDVESLACSVGQSLLHFSGLLNILETVGQIENIIAHMLR